MFGHLTCLTTTSRLTLNTAVNSVLLIHVAVGVICNGAGQVLIALRAGHQHQGNLWEFPGGKVEEGESCHNALVRELKEELGIDVQESRPLIQIEHHYTDKSVLLDVHRVTRFRGSAYGREGQPLRWVSPQDFNEYDFPEANKPILQAVSLPDCMAITGSGAGEHEFALGLQAALKKGAGMLMLRFKPDSDNLWKRCLQYTKSHYPSLPVVVSSSVGRVFWSELPGLHLTGAHLEQQTSRPVSSSVLLGASCHNAAQVAKANEVGVDYITLSPVLPTASHPGEEVLGWERFAELSRLARCPVYALGGLTAAHASVSRAHGGQGIAAIRYFWDQ